MADKINSPAAVTDLLAAALERRRAEFDLTYAQIARRIAIPAATLYRITNRTGTPDIETITQVASWLDMPLERVLKQSAAVVYYPSEPLPEIVAEILRRDQTLSPDDARTLAEIFRTAYAHYTKFGAVGEAHA